LASSPPALRKKGVRVDEESLVPPAHRASPYALPRATKTSPGGTRIACNALAVNDTEGTPDH